MSLWTTCFQTLDSLGIKYDERDSKAEDANTCLNDMGQLRLPQTFVLLSKLWITFVKPVICL